MMMGLGAAEALAEADAPALADVPEELPEQAVSPAKENRAAPTPILKKPLRVIIDSFILQSFLTDDYLKL